eukprot:jgi/Chlat1/1360/Chrsp119S01780
MALAESPAGSEDKLQAAEEKKKQANQYFQRTQYTLAVDLYTQAIELCGTNAVYYANRGLAHTRMENYGQAILDGDKAIQIDPNYVKGYYRRGAAYLALGKYKDGLKDFRKVVTLAPRDPEARRKLQQCEKAVQQLRFEEAISSDAGPVTPVSDTIDLTTMDVDDSYKGARIDGDQITLEFVQQMLADFKEQKPLHKRYAFQILLRVKSILQSLPPLVDIDVPEGSHFTVCGDVHGQFYDLCNIFELNGLPSEENPYLFNGDFVDRGSWSAEVILTLFAFKWLYPTGMHLTRGNHESRNMNKVYGFDGEIKHKYSDLMVNLFAEVFRTLPLGFVLNTRVLVVHGGLFSKDGVKLDDLRAIDRFQEPPDEGLMCELLWSDPQTAPGRSPSKRGVGIAFGPDVTKRFLEENGLELIVRSHEVKHGGYEVEHDGKLITIFSAPNYCDQMGNMGAFIRFQSDMVPHFTQFAAVPHPTMKPMAYASNFMSLLGG